MVWGKAHLISCLLNTDNHNPSKGSVEVSINSAVTLHIKDDHMGVDKTSVNVSVNGEAVTPGISGELKDYTVTYTPQGGFKYNEEVTISIDASDLAWVANQMEREEYIITMATDTIPPYTTDLNPAKEAVNVLIEGDIIIHVKDDLAGVDMTTIDMEVAGETVTPQVTGTASDYSITYHPEDPFFCSDTVNVVIRAEDLALPGNEMEENYVFYTITDKEAPFVTDHNPRPEEKNVALNTNISFRLRDNLSGVDTTSIILRVDSTEVKPFITGEPLNYLISFNPPSEFRDNQTVEVEVEALDRSRVPNIMVKESYSFTTLEDTMPPYTLDHYPARGAENVPLDTKIEVRVKDDLTGVDHSSITMQVNGEAVNPAMTGDKQSYQLSYQPQGLSYDDTVYIQIEASDLATPPNEMETDGIYNSYRTTLA